MAWDEEMVLILRDMIQDFGDVPVYTDERLSTSILVAGLLLQNTVSFANSYEISVTNQTMKPDPTKSATLDKGFVALACLRAALGLVVAEQRELTRGGIEIQDGDNRIKLNRDAASLKLMGESYKKNYDEVLYAYKTGGNDGLGEAIVSPYKYWSTPCDGRYPWSNPRSGRRY